MKTENFKAHGVYTVSNAISYLIELSDCGDSARMIVGDKITDWYEIEFVYDEDSDDMVAVIDSSGYNVPLEQVMRLDTPVSYAMNTCCICNGSYVGFGNNAEPIMDGECCNKCNYEEVIPARLSTFPLT